jgi:hypothetical protein
MHAHSPDFNNKNGGVNKHKRKPKGQSKTDNLETLTTLGTQDTERRETAT